MKTSNLVQKLFNKANKSSIAIDCLSYVENGVYYLAYLKSDDETYLSLPVELPNGSYSVINREMIRTEDLNEDRVLFPDKKDLNLSTTLQGADQQEIYNMRFCPLKDDMRPVMQSFHFSKDHIVATNAHILRYCKKKSNLEATIPNNPIILDFFKENKFQDMPVAYNSKDIMFTFESTSLTVRLVEVDFPNYLAVMPTAKNNDFAAEIDVKDISQIAKFQHQGKANFCIIEKNKIIVQNIDLNIRKEFKPMQSVKPPKQDANKIIMPTMVKDEDSDEYRHDVLGINFKLLNKLVTGYKGKITLAWSDSSRAISVYEQAGTITTKPIVKPKNNKTMKKETTTTKETTEKAVFLVNYSPKAIAVFGNTKKYKEQLKELKGRFNPYLKNEGEKTPGWIFSKKFEAEVTEFVNSL